MPQALLFNQKFRVLFYEGPLHHDHSSSMDRSNDNDLPESSEWNRTIKTLPIFCELSDRFGMKTCTRQQDRKLHYPGSKFKSYKPSTPYALTAIHHDVNGVSRSREAVQRPSRGIVALPYKPIPTVAVDSVLVDVLDVRDPKCAHRPCGTKSANPSPESKPARTHYFQSIFRPFGPGEKR